MRFVKVAVVFLSFLQVFVLRTNAQTDVPDFSTEAAIKKGRFIKVFTSKSRVYAGEPFEVTYKFYNQLTSSPSVVQQPDFNNFSVTELPFVQGVMPEEVDGEIYKSYIIRHVQLTAPEPGKHLLSKSIVEDVVTLPDPSDPAKNIVYKFDVSNPEQYIEVLPLPAKSKPEGFYGVTGNFSLTAKLSKDTLGVNETGHLLITIAGSGNIDAVNAPEINWPQGIEHFEPSDTQHIDDDNFPIKYSRVFDIPFVSKQTGSFEIPSFSLVFFNPSGQKYQSINSKKITPFFITAKTNQAEAQPVYQDDVTNHKYLWIVPAIALVVIAGGYLSYRRNKRNEEKMRQYKKQQAERIETKLKQMAAAEKQKSKTDFNALLQALEKNESDKTTFISEAKKILSAFLRENEIADTATVSKAEVFFKKCDYHLYAPFEEGNIRTEIMEELKLFIK